MRAGNCPQGGVSLNRTPLTRADVIAQAQKTLEQLLRIGKAPLQRKIVGEPERARQKNSFSGRQAIDFFFWVIPRNETVAHQITLDRCNRAAHAGIVRRQETYKRDHQKAGIQLFSSVELHEGIALCIESLTAYFIVNGRAEFAPALYRSLQTEALDRFDGTIHGHPCHHFRMGEMAARAAHLPYSFV